MVDLRSLQFKQYFPHAKMSQTLYFGLYSVAEYGDLGHEDVAKYGWIGPELPFHLCVSLLNEIGSWVNFRAISNQFPQKIDVCFVHLHNHNKRHKETPLSFCKLAHDTELHLNPSFRWVIPGERQPQASCCLGS